MNLLSAVLLLNFIVLSTVHAKDGVAPEPIPSTTVTPTTVTPSPSTKPPSPPPTPAPTSSTTKPTTASTTTTVTPTPTQPTTPRPTQPTTPKPTQPTTPKPTQPTTPKPTQPTTPKPSPTPAPKPTPGTWRVNTTNTTEDDSACILLKMTATFELHYINVNGNATGEGTVSIPIDAKSSGSCGSTEKDDEFIQLTWDATTNVTDNAKFVFSKDNNKFQLESVYVSLTLDPKNFPNARDGNKTYTLVNNEAHFSTPEKMSYKCNQITLPLNITTNITGNGTDATLKLTDFQFQAFGKIEHDHFAQAKDCEPYETPDIVPIAVGCALMALIIIVLIGYLIGRRRNQARGYLSM